MAGGEGTRLRPMTANQPKPLLPVVNKPIMEHVLLLLKRHGFTETVVTVQFLASLVRNYFVDGEDVGMSLQYATEEMPLGTAGSVKNAEDELRADPFLVISGDALTDIDLSALVRYHKDNSALVTVALTRVPNPLEFGIIIVGEDGRIQRFLEKPTWGQVFSDTVNTGIYVMEPEALAEVPAGVSVDWSGDVFPQLLKSGAPLYGWIADGYWEDVGSHESYLKAQADVLSGRVEAEIGGFEVSPGVWIREGAEVGKDVKPADLLREFDAVFLGVGLGSDSRLGIPGEEGAGVEGATAWIERMKLEPRLALDGVRRALVVGGGNTAIDAARELARLGVPEVAMVYRRTAAEMPGYRHEMEAARREGVRLVERGIPKAFLRDRSGRLSHLQLQDGQEIPADLALLAIGQAKLPDLAAAFPGVALDEKGRVVVEPGTGRTGNPRVFAGGDAVSGGELVVTAAQEGKRAARAIARALGLEIRVDAPMLAGHS